MPDALQWQFDQAPALFEAFGWTTMTSPDLEADDLLGSLATAEVDAGGRALIMTGDRDMYQCAAERVSVVYLKQGSSGFEEVDPAEVRRRYGIDPALVPDFIALRGDPSDGLPGRARDRPQDRGGPAQPPRQPGGGDRRTPTQSAPGSPLRCAITPTTCARSRTSPRSGSRRPTAPPDRETDLPGGAAAARAYGMNRLAERLEAADALTDL